MKTVQNLRDRILLFVLSFVVFYSCNTIANSRGPENIDNEDCNYRYAEAAKNNCGSCHMKFNNELSAGGFTLYDLNKYNHDSLAYLYDLCIRETQHEFLNKTTIDSIIFNRYCND